MADVQAADTGRDRRDGRLWRGTVPGDLAAVTRIDQIVAGLLP